MATIISNRQLIEPPPRQRRRYGLFDAATVLDMPDRVITAGLQYYADDCGDAVVPYNQTCDTSPLKTPNEDSELVGTDPFWLVTRKRCGTVGRTAEEIRSAARAQLDGAEQREVENVLWSGSVTLPGITDLISNPTTTIVVPDAPGAGAAVSALEEAYYRQNGYVGTIHVNNRAEGALQYAGMLQKDAGVLRTPVGTAVSLGAGYGVIGPEAAAPAAGFVWAFMTGYTTVWRSTDDQIPQPDPQRVMDRALNQWDVVSERIYAALWSCPEVFAVQIPLAAPATAATPAVPA